ncbi:helix-turn-helix transcriptional regulator [Cupriavidus metallidurans]|uniref:helix-turn-helix domain-containing protein n=2 Tax=Cupriavidus TaxID=106589 RepID=UPI00257D9AB1|nr:MULTISPECIES: helix-turn-helix transcriptional regulator [unclassified Cupriavidus]
MTQEQLAELLGTQATAISRMESGHTSPSLKMIGRLALALRTTPSNLLARAEEIQRDNAPEQDQ